MNQSSPLPSEEEIGAAVEDVLDEAHGEPPGESSAPVRMRVDESVEGVAEEAEETPGWAEKLVRVLDDGVKVPGTDFGVGIDGLIGFLLPGVGDFVTGSGSLALIYLAWKEKVPTVALSRMVLNIAIDTLGGALPVIGDIFDVFWKSNRKNLDIIEKYRDDPDAKPTLVDYVLVAVSVVLVITSIFLPFIVLWLLVISGVIAADQLLGQ
jgi:hypothetical protein